MLSLDRWKLHFEAIEDFNAASYYCEEQRIPVYVSNDVRLLLSVGHLSEQQMEKLRGLRAAATKDDRIGTPE